MWKLSQRLFDEQVRRDRLRLVWATDVHLNFIDRGKRRAFARALGGSGADATLLTGDISEAPTLEQHLLELAEEAPTPIYYVLGNHDFYRGSIRAVRERARHLTSRGLLRWLPASGVVPLTETTALVGCDGWGDARAGNHSHSSLLLNDFFLVEELAAEAPNLVASLRARGSAEAETLREPLDAALAAFPEVLVALHVPPFAELCPEPERGARDDYLPYFTCKAVGDLLLEAARRHPQRSLQVFCGHVHDASSHRPLPNLLVRSGAAHYGSPEIAGLVTTAGAPDWSSAASGAS